MPRQIITKDRDPGPIALFATAPFADRNLTSSTAHSAKAEDLLFR
jgi:hypothetical protein